MRNTETAIKAVLKNGKTAEANICYTISPVHTLEKYVQMAKDYAALGVKVIHVEDMAGMMNPKQVSDVIRAIRKEVGLPVHSMHTVSAVWRISVIGKPLKPVPVP